MMTDLIQTLKVIHSATVYHFLYGGGWIFGGIT